MSNSDPYQILGVSRTATADEIKRAYRRLVKEHHPDHNPGNQQAEKRFKQIQAAYEVLGDANRRSQYDRFGAGGPAPEYREWAGHAGRTSGGHGPTQVDIDSLGDLGGIFEQFFRRSATGRNGKRRTPRGGDAPGENIEHEVGITLEEAVRGAEREIALHDESGRLERIAVRIPAGIADGQAVRVKGRGQHGAAGRGDLLIRCRVVPHAYLRREGDDILLDLPLTVPEAVCGARIEIPTLDGATLLTVPAGATTGTRLRLRGRGVRNSKTGETGDLFAVVRVVLPRAPSAALKSLVTASTGEFGPDPRRDLGWPQ